MPIVGLGTGLAAFATPSDLAVLLQRTFSAEESAAAELILDVVSAEIRSYTGQTISAVADETITLDSPSGYPRRLFLPELPVTGVTSVTVDGTLWALTTDYYWYSDTGTVVVPYRSWGYLPQSVVVVYSHGYTTIPDDVRGVTLEVAAAMLGGADTAGDVKAEAIGNYSVTYADVARTLREVAAGRLDKYRVLVVA